MLVDFCVIPQFDTEFCCALRGWIQMPVRLLHSGGTKRGEQLEDCFSAAEGRLRHASPYPG